jgi:hypothetical protein
MMAGNLNAAEIRCQRHLTLLDLRHPDSELVPELPLFDAIPELFDDFANAISAEDLPSSLDSLRQLCALSAVVPIPVFPGCCEDHVPAVIGAILISDGDLHIELLAFVRSLLHFDNPPLLAPLVASGLAASLLFSVRDFVAEPPILSETVACLRDLVIASEDARKSLLVPEILDYFVRLICEETIPFSVRFAIAKLLSELAIGTLDISEVRQLLRISRAVLQDGKLDFAWKPMLGILKGFCSIPRLAKWLFETGEFVVEVNRCLLNSDPKICQKALSVLALYLDSRPVVVPVDFAAAVELARAEDEVLASKALGAIEKLVAAKCLEELDELDIFDVLKVRRAGGAFRVKLAALRVMIAIVRHGRDEDLAKCLNYNFMEDFLAMMELQELGSFKLSIGVMAKLLCRGINGAVDAYWGQLFDDGGAECLQALAGADDPVIADRSAAFLRQFVSARMPE